MKLTKRIVVYVLGIFILALGTVLFTRAGLGVSAIVSVPYTLSLVSPITLGMCTSIVYATFVIIEMILYRKITVKVILQIPFSFVFGQIIDLYNTYLKVQPETIVFKIIFLILAVVCTAIGICMMLKCNFIVNPPDGIVQAVSTVLKKDFGTAKWIFDLTMVIVAFIMGIVTKGQVLGIGIGTVVAVFTIGNCIKWINTHVMNKFNLEA